MGTEHDDDGLARLLAGCVGLPAAVQPVILDTGVASLPHRRKLTGPLATRLVGREPLITFITFGELAKWAEADPGLSAPPGAYCPLAVANIRFCVLRTLLLHMPMRRSACTFAIGNLVGGGGPSA
jgi:hypothetical protein